MEKKSTKIAYGVALAVIVVALAIGKIANDGSGFIATAWATPYAIFVLFFSIVCDLPPHKLVRPL